MSEVTFVAKALRLGTAQAMKAYSKRYGIKEFAKVLDPEILAKRTAGRFIEAAPKLKMVHRRPPTLITNLKPHARVASITAEGMDKRSLIARLNPEKIKIPEGVRIQAKTYADAMIRRYSTPQEYALLRSAGHEDEYASKLNTGVYKYLADDLITRHTPFKNPLFLDHSRLVANKRDLARESRVLSKSQKLDLPSADAVERKLFSKGVEDNTETYLVFEHEELYDPKAFGAHLEGLLADEIPNTLNAQQTFASELGRVLGMNRRGGTKEYEETAQNIFDDISDRWPMFREHIWNRASHNSRADEKLDNLVSNIFRTQAVVALKKGPFLEERAIRTAAIQAEKARIGVPVILPRHIHKAIAEGRIPARFEVSHLVDLHNPFVTNDDLMDAIEFSNTSVHMKYRGKAAMNPRLVDSFIHDSAIKWAGLTSSSLESSQGLIYTRLRGVTTDELRAAGTRTNLDMRLIAGNKRVRDKNINYSKRRAILEDDKIEHQRAGVRKQERVNDIVGDFGMNEKPYDQVSRLWDMRNQASLDTYKKSIYARRAGFPISFDEMRVKGPLKQYEKDMDTWEKSISRAFRRFDNGVDETEASRKILHAGKPVLWDYVNKSQFQVVKKLEMERRQAHTMAEFLRGRDFQPGTMNKNTYASMRFYEVQGYPEKMRAMSTNDLLYVQRKELNNIETSEYERLKDEAHNYEMSRGVQGPDGRDLQYGNPLQNLIRKEDKEKARDLHRRLLNSQSSQETPQGELDKAKIAHALKMFNVDSNLHLRR